MRVHGRHHFGGRVRAGDGEHARVRFANECAAALRTEATGDDYFSVLVEGFADRVQRFRDSRVDETAGVDDDEVGSIVRRRDRVAFGTQLSRNRWTRSAKPSTRTEE